MGTGEQRINKLGDNDFRGNVGKNVNKYSKELQGLARDLAAEFDNAATAADESIRTLTQRHKLLFGADARLRSRRVTRPLRRARDNALGLSAEAVKFAMEYRKQFLDVDDSGAKIKKGRGGGGGVDF